MKFGRFRGANLHLSFVHVIFFFKKNRLIFYSKILVKFLRHDNNKLIRSDLNANRIQTIHFFKRVREGQGQR